MSELKLEPGKAYRTRGGRHVEILERLEHMVIEGRHAFRGRWMDDLTIQQWWDGGNFYEAGNLSEHDFIDCITLCRSPYCECNTGNCAEGRVDMRGMPREPAAPAHKLRWADEIVAAAQGKQIQVNDGAGHWKDLQPAQAIRLMASSAAPECTWTFRVKPDNTTLFFAVRVREGNVSTTVGVENLRRVEDCGSLHRVAVLRLELDPDTFEPVKWEKVSA